MLKSCQYCGKIHSSKYQCSSKPRKRRKQYSNSNNNTDTVDDMTLAINRFRSSTLWQKKRKEIVVRDAGVCRVCLYYHTIHTQDLSVHHITPLVSDFERRLDESNLVTLCPLHHERAEKGEIEKEFLEKLASTPPTLGQQ